MRAIQAAMVVRQILHDGRVILKELLHINTAIPRFAIRFARVEQLFPSRRHSSGLYLRADLMRTRRIPASYVGEEGSAQPPKLPKPRLPWRFKAGASVYILFRRRQKHLHLGTTSTKWPDSNESRCASLNSFVKRWQPPAAQASSCR